MCEKCHEKDFYACQKCGDVHHILEMTKPVKYEGQIRYSSIIERATGHNKAYTIGWTCQECMDRFYPEGVVKEKTNRENYD